MASNYYTQTGDTISMIRSMTGYGHSSINGSGWNASWEIKSLNSKYLDIKWRTPQRLLGLQTEWESTLRSQAARGRVDAWLDLQIQDREFVDLNLNEALVARMLDDLNNLAKKENIPFHPDLSRLLNLPQVWNEGKDISPEIAQGIQETLEKCLEDWNRSREVEGRKMAEDIASRLHSLREMIQRMRDMARENEKNRTAALQNKLEKTLHRFELGEVDETRLYQELAIISDRVDVSEELTRLETHIEEMDKLLRGSGEIGRKLDFLLQEGFREINTCSNKCQDGSMNRLAVDLKTELEKCREQAQNLE